jgi:hypothetical protein
MDTLRKCIVGFGALCLSASLSSCVAVVAAGAAGAGTVAYIQGEFSATLDADPPRVIQAAESALSDLSIHVISSSSSGVDGEVTARTATDRGIKIKVARESDQRSKIGIRVDTFGDEALSREIYDKIKAKL